MNKPNYPKIIVSLQLTKKSRKISRKNIFSQETKIKTAASSKLITEFLIEIVGKQKKKVNYSFSLMNKSLQIV